MRRKSWALLFAAAAIVLVAVGILYSKHRVKVFSRQSGKPLPSETRSERSSETGGKQEESMGVTYVRPTGAALSTYTEPPYWKEYLQWRKTAEASQQKAELFAIADVATREGDLSDHAVETLIVYMQNSQFALRDMAAHIARKATSEAARSKLMPHLISLLSDEVALVRWSAVETLGIIGDTSVIPILEPLVDEYDKYDPDGYVAEAARHALAQLQRAGQ